MIRHLFATPSNPVRLVTDEAGAAEGTGAAQAALDVATNWWVMIPLVLVGAAAILTVQIRVSRARRLPADERAFRALARAARIPSRQRVMARALAKAHGEAPPVALLLSDHALTRAASRIELKPKSPGDRLLRRVLSDRGIGDPRPPATARTGPASGKTPPAKPKKRRARLRA